MVVCPNCRLESSDRFFCDRCNTLLPSPPPASLPRQVSLPDGRLVDCTGFHGTFPADCWRCLQTTCASQPCRVYALNRSWWRDLAAAIAQRAAVSLEVLAPIEVVPCGEGALVVVASRPGVRRPLLVPAPVTSDVIARLDDTLESCRLLGRALTALHSVGLVWLEFDPAGLLQAGDRIEIASLDLQLFAFGACPASLRLSGSYSPPEVCAFKAERIGPATDVFHVSLYAYYRLAGLLPEGFAGGGIEAFDFDFPPLRVYWPALPPGIAAVLSRGLCRDPADRFASVDDLLAALSGTIDQARQRAISTVNVLVDASGATAIGRMHQLQSLPNQDAFALVPGEPGNLLAIVADGVTHARVGSGDRASRLAVDTLAATLSPRLGEHRGLAEQQQLLTDACLEASRVILESALADQPIVDFDPVEVMSSTIVIGVIRGNELTLASAGDSRAYLVRDCQAEQLTVDGDVRCTYLGEGASPELVRELGNEGMALFTCLGVGEHGSNGRLVPSIVRSTPRVTQLRLLPGDVVVLCTDGLVEEGLFLEPAELAAVVTEGAELSAEVLANWLVEAAKVRHRDPSAWEPDGCGDDVTCIVLKVSAGEIRLPGQGSTEKLL